jgi:hypothetical protein
LPSTIKTANRFEVLYNFDEDETQEELGGKRLPFQFRTDDSDHRNQQPLITDFTCVIPVIIKGLTSVETNKKNINHKFNSNARQKKARR